MFHTPIRFSCAFLLLMLTVSSSAQADILFINLNHSVEESNSIRSGASANHETVVELPNFENPKAHALAVQRERLEIQKKSVQNKYYRIVLQTYSYGFMGRIFSSKYHKLIKESDALSAQMKVLETQINAVKTVPVTLEAIQKKVAALDKEGREISAIVLSGHSTGDTFWGSDTNFINPEFMFSLANNHPKVFRSLETIIFLACSTGATDKLVTWSALLKNPNRRIVAGFDGSAPSHFTTESHNIVSNILKTRAAFLNQTVTPEASQVWFKSLDPKVRETVLNVLVNDWIGGSSTKTKFVPINSLAENCEVGKNILLDTKKAYSAYLTPGDDELYKTLPPDSPSTQLRVMYRALQKYSATCKKEFNAAHFYTPGSYNEMPTREQVLALIHFPNMQMAFVHERGDQIAKFNRSLKDLGGKNGLFLSEKLKIGAIRRGEIVTQFEELNGYLSTEETKAANRPERLKQIKALSKQTKALKELLVDLKNVPLDWITFE